MMMEFWVKDLCNPDVVAEIAKVRFFHIRDEPNLTPEIWEKFKEMIPTVHHSQPVDPNDLEAKLRDCPPRLSEPPNTEDRTPSPDPPDVCAEKCRNGAEEAYNTLIKMGGRSTQPIRPTPPWIQVYLRGELCYRRAEPVKTLFYNPRYSFSQGPMHSLTEAEYRQHHWIEEKIRCVEELRRWQDFHDTQQRARERHPEKAREEDMERQRYPHDPQLTASLKKLKDWKEYMGYFRKCISGLRSGMVSLRLEVEAIERKDPEVVWSKWGTGEYHGRSSHELLRMMERQLEQLAGEEIRLDWVEKQLPAVLSECAMSLMDLPTSRREMEERSELGAKQVYKTLIDTHGRPSRPIRSVPDIHDAEHIDEHAHVLCHWEGECSQFEEELRKWKKFLDYRQKKDAKRRMEVQLEEQQHAETTTQVDLWREYRVYQQEDVDIAKQWVEFWQRQVKNYQQAEDDLLRQGVADIAKRMHSQAEVMQSHAEDARKQVEPVKMRMEWVEQQFLTLLTDSATLAEASRSDHPAAQTIEPQRLSRSGQFKGLGSDRFGRSTLQSNQKPDNNKKRASADSVLGPIHSSKVSKAAGRKIPRPQQQSKIPAEPKKNQNQGLNITIPPLPPANVTPRRSRRLSTNHKRPSPLKANLTADLGGNAQTRATKVMLRRSDRITKHKERISTTSSTALSSVGILQTAPFPRPKPKGRVAGIKPDRS